MKKLCFALVFCFAMLQLAQAASSLGFDVARTPEQIQQLSALSNADLAAHLESISNEAIAEQVEVLNDGRHGILLARILGALAKGMNFMDEGRRNSLIEGLNGLGLPFEFSAEDGTIELSSADSQSTDGSTPFLTDGKITAPQEEPEPEPVSKRAIR